MTATVFTGVTIDNLPGSFRLFFEYSATNEYCGPPDPGEPVKKALLTLAVETGALAYPLGGKCPGVRPTVEWTYSPPCGSALTGATIQDICAQGAGLCTIPADVLANLDKSRSYFIKEFRAKIETAIQPNRRGKGSKSSLVKDGADEFKLAATDGPIDASLQPALAPDQSFVFIDPVLNEKSVVTSNLGARGDWDNVHFKEEVSLGVFFPGCNSPLVAGLDQNRCLHLHESWLNKTPGANLTYSRGQKVLWYDLVFHPGEESPNGPASINNGEALGTPSVTFPTKPFGKDLVLWVESIAASKDCAPTTGAGGLDNTARPCRVFPQGLFFTPR